MAWRQPRTGARSTVFPATRVQREVRWVDEGRVVTAGIDMSVHLAERLLERAVADATAYAREYRWNEDGATPQP